MSDEQLTRISSRVAALEKDVDEIKERVFSYFPERRRALRKLYDIIKTWYNIAIGAVKTWMGNTRKLFKKKQDK